MVKIGIIGYGYWGPNLVRNFSAHPGCEVTWVSDVRQPRLDLLGKNFPAVKTTTDYKTIINDTETDAVVIATPVFLHHPIAMEALKQGKHVLIEKPMATSEAEAQELVNYGKQKNLVVMVDHTFLYTGAVGKIKSIIEAGDIGQLKYFDSERINLGLFQADINVVWDLAPHDISILTYLVGEKPLSVQATGVCHTNNGLENMAYITVNYQSDFIAHFSCSWTSPVKIRKILIGGDKRMIMYNDVEPTEKVRIYDTGYSHKSDEDKHRILVDYRIGDIYLPKVEQKEALAGVANDFISAIKDGTTPTADAENGLLVVKILEAANKSIKQRGTEIKLNL